MPISSLNGNTNDNTIGRYLMYFIAIAGIIGVVYFGGQALSKSGGLQKRSALSVEVYNTQAEVFLDDSNLGATPVNKKDIEPGEHTIRVRGHDREYVTQLDFIPNDKNYIHNVGIFADLGTSTTFSSVQEFWFEKDKGANVVRVVSDPSGAKVFIDNTQVGETPYASDKLSDGEYDIHIEYPGYETQIARINVKKGYTLNVKFKMFPIPAPANIKLMEGAENFYDLSTTNEMVSSDTLDWVEGLIYWNKTRGINLEGTGLNKEPAFEYFVDYKGNIFGPEGGVVIGPDDLAKLKDAKKGAYLGRISDGTGITKEARDAILGLRGVAIGSKTGTILTTGTGWLRVRALPGLNGTEVGRATVGQTYEVLEEGIGWVRIKLSDTVNGWVSSDYISISE